MHNQSNFKELSGDRSRTRNYSLCRASCSVCPYHKGLLKLLDHGKSIVPTLPEREPAAEADDEDK